MAKGYPDYFGQSIWPKYGSPIVSGTVTVECPGSATTTFYSISAQGVLFSARIKVYPATWNDATCIRLYVDDALFEVCYFMPSLATIFGGSPGNVLGVIHLDTESKYVEAVLNREVPFHTSFRFDLVNASANIAVVIYRATHYVVT